MSLSAAYVLPPQAWSVVRESLIGGDQRVGDPPDVREALWRSRRALAAAPSEANAAFPGVERCSAATAHARLPQQHPFCPEASLLRGHVFQAKGRRWCVEEVTVIDAEGRLGVYAFDADTHTEATQLLTERCTVFGAEWIDKLQGGAAAGAEESFAGGGEAATRDRRRGWRGCLRRADAGGAATTAGEQAGGGGTGRRHVGRCGGSGGESCGRARGVAAAESGRATRG